MGSAQHYCLKWNHHLPNFTSSFSDLLLSNSLVDVTLAADGKHLQAHKLVLSACSPYFQELFTVNPNNHPIVILKDIGFDHLRIIVEFMYKGEVNISKEELDVLLQAAGTLQVKGLSEISANSPKNQKSYGQDENGSLQSIVPNKPDDSDFIHSGKRRKTSKPTHKIKDDTSETEDPQENVQTVSTSIVKSIDAAYDQLDISSLFMVKTENDQGCGQFSGCVPANVQPSSGESNNDGDRLAEPGPSDENDNSQGKGVKRKKKILRRQDRLSVSVDDKSNIQVVSNQDLNTVEFILSDDSSLLTQSQDESSGVGYMGPRVSTLTKSQSRVPLKSSIRSISAPEMPPNPDNADVKARIVEVDPVKPIRKNSRMNAVLKHSDSSPSELSADLELKKHSFQEHCPKQREGPRLSCFYCWNTADPHGRFLRRKTQYYCKECQKSLCIVPCFQDFHVERGLVTSSS